MQWIIEIAVVGAVIITACRVYFAINKLWPRKHLRDVADSISLFAVVLSILTVLSLFVKYAFLTPEVSIACISGFTLLDHGFRFFVACGVWVPRDRPRNFASAILETARRESSEAGALLHAAAHPHSPQIVFEILTAIACIDGEYHDREAKMLEGLADEWALHIEDFDQLRGACLKDVHEAVRAARQRLGEFLSHHPSAAQAELIRDFARRVMEADHRLHDREVMLCEELGAQLDAHCKPHDAAERYEVLCVPITAEQRGLVVQTLGGAAPTDACGGSAYQMGAYHTRDCATAICHSLRNLGIFTMVNDRDA